MKTVWTVLIGLAALWLQTSFFPAIHWYGVVPNVCAVVLVLAGLLLSPVWSLGLALGVGLGLDLASGADFGLRMGYMMMLVLIVVTLVDLGLAIDNLGLLVALVFGVTILYNLAVLASLAFAHVQLSLLVVARPILLEVGINVLLLLVLRPILQTIWYEPTGTFMARRGSR